VRLVKTKNILAPIFVKKICEASAKLVNRIIPAYVFPKKNDIHLIINMYDKIAGTGFNSFGGISKLKRNINATITDIAVIKTSDRIIRGRGIEAGKRMINLLFLICLQIYTGYL
jgi:hypothetical protein